MSRSVFNSSAGDADRSRKELVVPYAGIGLAFLGANLLFAASAWAGLSDAGSELSPNDNSSTTELMSESNGDFAAPDLNSDGRKEPIDWPLSSGADLSQSPFFIDPIGLGNSIPLSNPTSLNPPVGVDAQPLLIPLPTAISTGGLGLTVVAILLTAKRTLRRRLFA